MQHISNITNLQSYQAMNNSEQKRRQSGETQTSSKANAVPYNTLRVWDKFSQIYGRGFLTEFGDIPNDSWIEEIEKLSPADVERGIKASQALGTDFAPRLPKFLKLCEPPIVEDEKKQERETYEKLRLPRPPASEAIKNKALADMKNLLKFKPNQVGEVR